jgi:F-type H+-transporting ATPase subunit delta
MKNTPAKHYAAALFEACRKKPEAIRAVVKRFGELLKARHDLRLLPRIADELDAYARKAEGLTDVEIQSATPLSDAQAKTLLQARGLKTEEISLRTSTDPQIIGGMRVRIGDRLIDGSVRFRLSSLRQKLEA